MMKKTESTPKMANASEKSPNRLSEGHRDRKRNAYLETNFAGLMDYELLEFLLFHSIPRKDTKLLAKELLKYFGSLSAVFDAHTDDLLNFPGVGKSTAALLKFIPVLARAYELDTTRPKKEFDSFDEIRNYLEKLYIGKQNEVFTVLCLNRHMNLMKIEQIEGSSNAISTNWLRTLTEATIRAHADMVVMAHNHPSGTGLPSEDDLASTEKAVKTMESLGIILLEHYVVGSNGARPILHQ